MPVTIPNEYGYVLLTVAGTFLVSTWHFTRIGAFRKAARVRYPQFFATKAEIEAASSPEHKKALYLFNCAQRSHMNFLETYTQALVGILVAGVKYPKAASALGAWWAFSRVLYAVGYTNYNKADGKGRYAGAGHYIGLLGLMGLSIASGWEVLNS